jgi:hypothetical protein
MVEMNKNNKELKEFQKVKYVRELTEYWTAYMYAVINEIFVGIGVNLGLTEDKAYDLSQNNPKQLKKAGFLNKFLKGLADKFKRVFSHKVPKFRVDFKLFEKDKPIDNEKWDRINKKISDYWKKTAHKVAEEMAVKGYILGRDTAKYQKKDQEFETKSFEQVAEEDHGNNMPSSISEAYRKHYFNDPDKKTLNKSFSKVAMHVAEVESDVKDSIRKIVTTGVINGKGPQEIASDMYWNVQKAMPSAAVLRRNWSRTATTEMQSVYEAGILAQYEEEARESLSDPAKARYFVYTGGSCNWCRAHQGTVVRLLPDDIIPDKDNDSLSALGIEDSKTDTAVWIGKNNVGRYSYKAPYWQICTPAHPHGVATLTPIDFDKEFFNEKTGRVEKKQLYRTEFVPKRKDYEITEADRERRKPTFISTDRVSFNNNVYERVSPEQYKTAIEKWQNDPSLPIPVSTESTRYDKIFGAAERNQNDL